MSTVQPLVLAGIVVVIGSQHTVCVVVADVGSGVELFALFEKSQKVRLHPKKKY